MSEPDPPAPEQILARLQRLEESHVFAERTLEQLGDEIADLNRRLAEMRAHVQRLEARLTRSEQPGDDEPPADSST